MTLLDALKAADTTRRVDGMWGDYDYARTLDWSKFAREGGFSIGGHLFTVAESDLSHNQSAWERAEVYIVFVSAVTGEAFKKTGYADSYSDDHYWDGPIVPVAGRVKQIVVWEEI